jgi:transposase InsO family protein
MRSTVVVPIRDRDGIYGVDFRQRVKQMGIEEVVTAPRSPWQNPYVERLIDSIRRECLNHVIVFREAQLPAADMPQSPVRVHWPAPPRARLRC